MVVAMSGVDGVTPIEVNIPVNILDRCTQSAISLNTASLTYTHGCLVVDSQTFDVSTYLQDQVTLDNTNTKTCTSYLQYALVTTSLSGLSNLALVGTEIQTTRSSS